MKFRDEAKKLKSEGKSIMIRPYKIIVDNQELTFNFESNTLIPTGKVSGNATDSGSLAMPTNT